MACCGGGDMMGWAWLWGGLWLLLIAGGIALIVWAIGRGGRRGHAGPERPEADRALVVLRERFARGEIGEAEYRARRGVLDDAGAG